MFKVVLTRGITEQVYGTYATREQAEQQAADHKQTKYWDKVEVR